MYKLTCFFLLEFDISRHGVQVEKHFAEITAGERNGCGPGDRTRRKWTSEMSTGSEGGRHEPTTGTSFPFLSLACLDCAI